MGHRIVRQVKEVLNSATSERSVVVKRRVFGRSVTTLGVNVKEDGGSRNLSSQRIICLQDGK